jgi:hypothetical protein
MRLTSALLALAFSTLMQRAPSPQELLRLQRPLSAGEIDTVVRGIRQALDGTTLRLRESRGAEREILMGGTGTPRMTRSSHLCIGMADGECVASAASDPPGVARVPTRFVVLTEFTGEPARRCSGSPAAGEMVRQYVLNEATQTWTISVHPTRPGQIFTPRPLELLRSTPLTIGGSRPVGGRAARAILGVPRQTGADDVVLTGDPAPNPVEFIPVESLWIDVDLLLPLRWEVSRRQATVAHADFLYEKLELQRPSGVEVPTCVP